MPISTSDRPSDHRPINRAAPRRRRHLRRPAITLALLLAAAGLNLGMMCHPVVNPPGGSQPVNDLLAQLLAIRSIDHVEGSADAPITVVEYVDFQCPFCGSFARNTFPTIKQEFIDTGQVRWVHRHFPLRTIHQFAESAARASECAGDQNMFDAYATHLWMVQQANPPPLTNNDLKSYAATLGLDTAAFNACLDSGEKAARVQMDVDNGFAAGVNSTPTFFINGRKVTGNKTVDQFRAELMNP